MAATEIWRSNVVCRIAEPRQFKDTVASWKGSTISSFGDCECPNWTVQWSSNKNISTSTGLESRLKGSPKHGHSLSSRRQHGSIVAEAGVEAAGETGASGSTVQVTFKLYRQCNFGQRFHISGSEDFLGSWDVDASIPLDWSEGDIWSTQLEVPAGVTADFKFVLVGKRGEVEWSPGSNKTLDTTSGASPLIVVLPWDNEELPAVPEAGTIVNAAAELTPVEVSDDAVDNAPYESAVIDAGVDPEEETIAAIKVLDEAIAQIDQILDEGIKALAQSVQVEGGQETKEGLEGELQPLGPNDTVSDESEVKFEIRDGPGGGQGNVNISRNGAALGEEKEVLPANLKAQSDTDLPSNPPSSNSSNSLLSAAKKQSAVGEEEVKTGNGALLPLASSLRRIMPQKGSVLAKDAQWGLKVWESLLGSLGRKPLMEEEPQSRSKSDSR